MVHQNQWASTFGRTFYWLIHSHAKRSTISGRNIVQSLSHMLWNWAGDGIERPKLFEMRGSIGANLIEIVPAEFKATRFVSLYGMSDSGLMTRVGMEFQLLMSRHKELSSTFVRL